MNDFDLTETELEVANILADRFEQIMDLIESRQAYKTVREFDKADKVRDTLLKWHHIQLKDTKEGLKLTSQKMWEEK